MESKRPDTTGFITTSKLTDYQKQNLRQQKHLRVKAR